MTNVSGTRERTKMIPTTRKVVATLHLRSFQHSNAGEKAVSMMHMNQSVPRDPAPNPRVVSRRGRLSGREQVPVVHSAAGVAGERSAAAARRVADVAGEAPRVDELQPAADGGLDLRNGRVLPGDHVIGEPP